jgi:hypothetical protein
MARLLGGLLAVVCLGVLLTQAAQAGDSVKGQVVFNGPVVPKQMIIPAGAAQAFCKACQNGPLLTENWIVDPNTKGVMNVVVFLTDAKDPKRPIPHADMKVIQEKKVVLDQPCCKFIPHVVVLVEGQTLEAKNSSTAPHNTNILSPGGNPNQNKALAPGQSVLVTGWKAVGRTSVVECNIHPWMKAWIFTVPSPYFAVTDKDGNFEIKDVPPGDYRIVYWHEEGGWLDKAQTSKGDPLTVKPGGTDVGKIKAQ